MSEVSNNNLHISINTYIKKNKLHYETLSWFYGSRKTPIYRTKKNKIAENNPSKRKVFRNYSFNRENYRITLVYPSLRGLVGEGSASG